MTLFKCQMYLARTALIGDTFQIELEFRNVGLLLACSPAWRILYHVTASCKGPIMRSNRSDSNVELHMAGTALMKASNKKSFCSFSYLGSTHVKFDV